jgi:hypothetical protein
MASFRRSALLVIAVVMASAACGGHNAKSFGITQPGLAHVDLVADYRADATVEQVSAALKDTSDPATLTRFSIHKCRSTFPLERPGALYCEFDGSASRSQRRAYAAFLQAKGVFRDVRLPGA